MRRVIVFYNRSAGSRRRPDLSGEIRSYLGSEWSVELIHITPEALQHHRVAELLADRADLAMAVGGDGTVMACAAALHGQPTPLAILPTGTANIIARNLGIPLSIENALDVAVHGARRQVDLGEAAGSRFVMAGGIGIQADFFSRTNPTLKASAGVIAYGIAALTLLSIPPDTFTLTLDERQPIIRTGYGVLVGDLSRFASVRQRWTTAAADDGKFEVMVLRHHLAVSAMMPVDRFVADWFQARSIQIQAAREHRIMLDGELLAPGHTFAATCAQRVLTVCVPDNEKLRPWKTPLSALRAA